MTTTTEENTPQLFPGFKLVEVDSLQLAYKCKGTGSPAVVISHGIPGPDITSYIREWDATIDALAEITEVCIFERPGLLQSDARALTPDDPQTTQIQVDDFVEFVGAVDLEPPVIALGYEWGGLIGQLLAHQHPDLVAALLLVSSFHPDQNDRLGLPELDPFPPEHIDMVAGMAEVAAVNDLRDLPLHVLTASDLPRVPEEEREEIRAVWIGLQEELAALSTNSKHEIVEDVGPSTIRGASEAIAGAIEDLMNRIAERSG